jgi:hypothetical protein
MKYNDKRKAKPAEPLGFADKLILKMTYTYVMKTPLSMLLG